MFEEYYNIYNDFKVIMKDAVDFSIQSTPKDYGQHLLNGKRRKKSKK